VAARVVDDATGAAAILRGDLQQGDVVLLKASRAAALEKVVAALRAARNETVDGGVEA
jgi:UDP-N-acetylmuramyl pentapeptide synthase